ncbi:hypothetical protein LCGC14_0595140 [marine sediment metagenome]|uniref:Uncharacterized protein n=1 Tax=marine sediment metagenome TaxID=412755 RepID=A0A0F9RC97_9ZZZZ
MSNKVLIAIIGAILGVAVTRIERKADSSTHAVIGAIVGSTLATQLVKPRSTNS